MPVNTAIGFQEAGVDIYQKYLAADDAQWVDLSYFSAQGLENIGKGLWAWGGSSSYGIGLGDRNTVSSPVQIGTLKNWKTISTDRSIFNAALAVKSDGTLWAWGRNSEGQLGLNDRTHRSSPVQVGSLTNWSKVDINDRMSLAIKTDGTLWQWGTRTGGNLSSPVQVGTATDWVEIAAGHYAIKSNGTLWAFEVNILFDAGVPSSSTPVQVGTLTDWSKITTGQSADLALATKTDGTLWVWGVTNTDGQLGLNDTVHRFSPVQNIYITSGINRIFSSGYHSFAIRSNGQLFAWGHNQSGELGLNDRTHRSIPTNVGNLTNWKEISGGFQGFIATKTDGTFWATGEITNLVGSSLRVSSPVQIGSMTNWTNVAGDAGTGFGIRL